MNSNGESNDAKDSAWLRAGFLGIMLLAAFLRLYQLDLISVTNETAFQELTAASALSFDGWNWPLAGPPTEDVRSSAFLPSAIAVANVAWRHPFAGVVLLIAMNVCAVALLFQLCHEHFGRHVALIATLLYATSPWAVMYARMLIPVSCLALFTVALIHFALRWLNEKGKIQLTIIVVLAFALPQIHFTGVVAPVWLSIVLYIGRRHLATTSLVCGVLIGALLWIPWIAFQQITEWEELHAFFAQVFLRPADHGQALLQSLSHIMWMSQSSGFEFWFGQKTSELPMYFPSWQRWGFQVAAILMSVFLLASVFRGFMRSISLPARLLLFWIGLAVFFGMLIRTGMNPDNLLVAFPVPFVLIGLMSERMLALSPRNVRHASTITLLAISLLHVAFLANWFRFVDNEQTSGAGKYEFSYRQRQDTIQSVVRDARTLSVRLVGEFSGWYPAYEYVLSFQPANEEIQFIKTNEPVCYWIDELTRPADRNAAAWMKDCERRINLTVSESLRTPPDWVIERHWSVGDSQVYRIRLAKKVPIL